MSYKMKEMLRQLYFFSQAADGIRDPLVTGVQTCALPISRLEHAFLQLGGDVGEPLQRALDARSEERRGGKECRSRWWPYHEKKKMYRKQGVCGGRRSEKVVFLKSLESRYN